MDGLSALEVSENMKRTRETPTARGRQPSIVHIRPFSDYLSK